jgi:hypothetical protein
LSFIITAGFSILLAIIVDISRRIVERRAKKGREGKVSKSLTYVVDIFRPVLLSLSDQHLVIGNAILSAALIKLSEMSPYHLGIVLGLASLSAYTHTLILWCLWPFLNKSPTVYLRMLLMACQSILTIYLLSKAKSSDGTTASWKLIPCTRWGDSEVARKYAASTEQFIEFTAPLLLLGAVLLSIISYRGPGSVVRPLIQVCIRHENAGQEKYKLWADWIDRAHFQSCTTPKRAILK